MKRNDDLSFRERAARCLVYGRTFLCGAGLILAAVSPSAAEEDAQWIWAESPNGGAVAGGTCFFRRSLSAESPEEGIVAIAADDAYELYVNGRRVAGGVSQGVELTEHDVTEFLARGRNVIAVKVENVRGNTAAVAAHVRIKDRNGSWQSFSTDRSWVTNLKPLPLWSTLFYNDGRWQPAHELGLYGQTAPWHEPEAVAGGDQSRPERFRIADEFQLEQVLDGDRTGPLVALTFNEFGDLLAARKDGSVLRIRDQNNDGQWEDVQVCCDQIKGCQGILAVNGSIYVTGEGPEGCALYCLSDEDRDGQLENVRPVVRFRGAAPEHGPHGLALGPDGMLYIAVGNYAEPDGELDPASPYRDYYEGDLVQPRYEDPRGYAAGRKAPGGTIVRTDVTGSSVQLVAGGLQNPRDLAFSRDGELFAQDSDMEADQGMSWYRPTRLYHVTAGAEFGWRSGWAKWPDYFVDSLPGILNMGSGSPTGAVFYNHLGFPRRYQDALFLADRSQGRILVVRLTEQGAGYAASTEPFLEGQPLDVTDLDVAPDGSLYVATGDGGTTGGIYRVSWKGKMPAGVTDLGEGISAAIRQPQLHSAYGRQQIAAVKHSLGDEWDRKLIGVCRSTGNPAHYRIRALQLMQLFGSPPTKELLLGLSRDDNANVRAEVATQLATLGEAESNQRLVDMLADADATVRRRACEALLRAGQTAPWEKLSPLLAAEDRFESWAGRRLLERTPVDVWRQAVLTTKEHRLFIQGSLALLTAHGNPENARAMLRRFEQLTGEFVSDRNFIDLLRVAQVALAKGSLTARDVPQLAQRLGDEFPSQDHTMNRELVRLLAYLQVDAPMDRYLEYLKSGAPDAEKLHLALHLRFLPTGWQEGQRLTLIEFYEQARRRSGGSSYAAYIAAVERDFAKNLSPSEGSQVLARGVEWPGAAVGVLYNLPETPDEDVVDALSDLDRQAAGSNDESAKQLRLGIVAVLGRSKSARAMEYLRQAWDEDPERRFFVAMGLAQQPEGANFDYLLRSLPVLEGDAAQEVLSQLSTAEKKPDDPEVYRQVILLGLRLREHGAQEAVAVLNHWKGEPLVGPETSWLDALQAWQKWYTEQYPDRLPAVLPVAHGDAKWTYEQLLTHLTAHGTQGSPARGAAVFEKARCAACHRGGGGPDLSSVSRRMAKKEILEALLYPSHRISGADATRKSTMPEGLLDPLSIEEITDLFAYLSGARVTKIARERAPNGKR